jgi:hypothetical protein
MSTNVRLLLALAAGACALVALLIVVFLLRSTFG